MFTVCPVGPDEVYLLGPFHEREEVFLDPAKHTGQSPVKLREVLFYTDLKKLLHFMVMFLQLTHSITIIIYDHEKRNST